MNDVADKRDFSLISLSGDGEEDDVVIQAGAVPATTQRSESPAETAEPDSSEQPVSHERVRYRGVSEETAALLDEADDEARAEFARHMKEKHDREATAYETTEEDLHAKGPYQGMRSWILIAAAVFIVAFIVYWNVAFGS
ncbi:MAG: hypothetical protein HUJ65_06135 [Oscillospiraceae bacterium]|nr:hypothetical protein [Oscillospiraceae bacterium]